MGTITVAAIINKVRWSIGDQEMARHPDEQLLAYLNEAQRAAVLIRPEVNPVTENAGLKAGSRQRIPVGGYVMLGVTRNMGSDGETPGRAITPTDRENLDQSEPNWNVATANAVSAWDGVTNFVYDTRVRDTFYIFPAFPSDAGTWNIEIVYAKSPVDSTLGNAIQLDDVYEPALVCYMMHKACAKDPASPEDIQKSAGYLAMFTNLITGNADQKELELVVRHSPAENTRGGP